MNDTPDIDIERLSLATARVVEYLIAGDRFSAAREFEILVEGGPVVVYSAAAAWCDAIADYAVARGITPPVLGEHLEINNALGVRLGAEEIPEHVTWACEVLVAFWAGRAEGNDDAAAALFNQMADRKRDVLRGCLYLAQVAAQSHLINQALN